MGRPVVAIVTGANRGIGDAIAHTLADQIRDPFVLYATSREGIDTGLKTNPDTQVKYPSLDITNSSSIQDLAKTIKEDHGVVDVLINNAGANLDDEYSPENVKLTLDTNVRGTLHMCQTFLPLLSKTGRIVNVSSTGSSLNQYSKSIQQRFRSSELTLKDLEGMMQEYQDCANKGTESQHGWPQQAYSVSKACINALTAVLARENPGLVINACCPGWVSTDSKYLATLRFELPRLPYGASICKIMLTAMKCIVGKMVGSTPPKAPSDGAKIPIRLGFGDIDGVTGRYWGNPSIADTGYGQVVEW